MKKGLEIVSFWFEIAIFSVLFSLYCLLFIAFFEFNFDYSRAFFELSKESNENLKFMYMSIFALVLIAYGGFKILLFKSKYLNVSNEICGKGVPLNYKRPDETDGVILTDGKGTRELNEHRIVVGKT